MNEPLAIFATVLFARPELLSVVLECCLRVALARTRRPKRPSRPRLKRPREPVPRCTARPRKSGARPRKAPCTTGQ